MAVQAECRHSEGAGPAQRWSDNKVGALETESTAEAGEPVCSVGVPVCLRVITNMKWRLILVKLISSILTDELAVDVDPSKNQSFIHPDANFSNPR